MSMQSLSGGPNPFTIVGRFIDKKYREGARAARDSEQMHLTQSTLAMHSAQYEATKAQTAQQANLAERSEKRRSGRATEFLGVVHNYAQPGAPVSMKHGDISASYTSKMSTPAAAPKPGRVPVKKVRGGKKVQ